MSANRHFPLNFLIPFRFHFCCFLRFFTSFATIRAVSFDVYLFSYIYILYIRSVCACVCISLGASYPFCRCNSSLQQDLWLFRVGRVFVPFFFFYSPQHSHSLIYIFCGNSFACFLIASCKTGAYFWILLVMRRLLFYSSSLQQLIVLNNSSSEHLDLFLTIL